MPIPIFKTPQPASPGSATERKALNHATRTIVDMCCTLNYAANMNKMIQVRNVPDTLHRLLKARAAMNGMSLSDYLLSEMRELAERPTWAELRERMRQRAAVRTRLDTAAAVRWEREAR